MEFVAIGLVIFLSIGLHEYAHAKVADMAGDPTPRMQGRVTLNLTKHFELMGTIMIVITSLTGFGIGWGKPVMVNPAKMRNPRWDHFASVIAGPLTNICLAMLFAIIFRIVAITSPFAFQNPFIGTLLTLGVFTNLALALFNLIPFGPLDGHWLVGLLLPEPARLKWFRFNQGAGAMILLLVILSGQFMRASTGISPLYYIIGLPAEVLFQFFTGTTLR